MHLSACHLTLNPTWLYCGTHQEEEVSKEVVEMPEGEISLEETPLLHRLRVLKLPKKVS